MGMCAEKKVCTNAETGPSASELFRALREAHNAVEAMLMDMAKVNITKHEVLGAIGRSPGITKPQIQVETGLTRSAVNESVLALMRLGWVDHVDLNSSGAARLELTPDGVKAWADACYSAVVLQQILARRLGAPLEEAVRLLVLMKGNQTA